MPIEQSLPLLSSLIIPKSCLTRRADLSGFWSFTLSPANSCRQVQSSPSATALASPKAPTVGALPPAYPCSRVASAQCSNIDNSPASIRSFVFTYKDAPVARTTTKAWKHALARAGIENFRWHDLRHTWASWHVRAVTSLQEFMQHGGWSSFEMVLRYAHLASEHLRDAAMRVAWHKPDTMPSEEQLEINRN